MDTLGGNVQLSYATGRQIGDFVIEEPIGRGGMAVVYRARQLSVSRQVALKVIELNPGRSDFLKRFTREAEVIAMLEHIHILPIYGYGVFADEFAYYAMRLMSTGSLEDALRRGALPLEEALDVFAQIASALQYMHKRGVIHRDLKPSNILLDETGNAYLSDFGLAHLAELEADVSEDSLHMGGSPGYIAPEVIEGAAPNSLSDIYSLGIILYQMLCGQHPFASVEGNVSAMLYKHLREKPPPPHQLNPRVPAAVEAVVLRALSKNPRERYLSADEMAYELRAAVMDTPPSVLSIPTARMRQMTSRRWFYLLLIAVVVALIGLATLLLQQHNHPIPTMNVITGAQAGLADLTLRPQEIDLARHQLGQSGFIAQFPCTLSDPYQAMLTRAVSDLAAQNGLAMQLYNADSDVALEVAMVDQARLAGAKALILCPLNEPVLNDSIHSLQRAMLPLVLSLDYDTTYGIKLDRDDTMIGQIQGRYAGELLQGQHGGQGAVVLLTLTDVRAGQERAQGMEAGLHETAPQASVIGPLEGGSRGDADYAIQTLIAQHTPFSAVIAMNDAGALGAIDALKAANRTPQDVFVVSGNNLGSMQLDAGQEGYVKGSVTLDYRANAQLLFTGVVKALAGSPVAEYLMLNPGTLITRP